MTVSVDIWLRGTEHATTKTIDGLSREPAAWTDEHGIHRIGPGRDPYEAQAEAFLDAVETHDPDAVLSTYADALRTDRLTRAVVAATGRPG